jgi:hypothetical protein
MQRTLSVLGVSLLFCLATAGTATANIGSGPLFGQSQTSSQSQSGSNSVSQDASSQAISAPLGQINLNAPIGVLSSGSNGPVTQSNSSSATSSASNESQAVQLVDQSQGSAQTQDGSQTTGCCETGGSGSPTFDQEQTSNQSQSGSNAVSQNAESKTVSEPGAQVNVNLPIRILSDGSNGNVDQSNRSSATSSASNESKAIQIVDQTQGSSQTQRGEQSVGCCDRGGTGHHGHHGHHGHDGHHGHHGHDGKQPCGCEQKDDSTPVFDQDQTSNQSQSGSNAVSQNARSKAVSKPGEQANVNAPVSLLGRGCGCDGKDTWKGAKGGDRCECGASKQPSRGGDVRQSNASTAGSTASNESWAAQGVGQSQASRQGQFGLQRL